MQTQPRQSLCSSVGVLCKTWPNGRSNMRLSCSAAHPSNKSTRRYLRCSAAPPPSNNEVSARWLCTSTHRKSRAPGLQREADAARGQLVTNTRARSTMPPDVITGALHDIGPEPSASTECVLTHARSLATHTLSHCDAQPAVIHSLLFWTPCPCVLVGLTAAALSVEFLSMLVDLSQDSFSSVDCNESGGSGRLETLEL